MGKETKIKYDSKVANLLFIIKALLSGILIASISTLAKHSPKWAAFLTSLPLVTYLSMIWIYAEHRNLPMLQTYTYDVLIWTLPGLMFFIAAILFFKSGMNFYLVMILATLILALAVLLFSRLGILK